MKPFLKFLSLILLFSITLVSCRQEDPGPEQHGSRNFVVTDFDKVEAGDAFDVTIQQGSSFSIDAQGDVRDLDDLVISKSGSTLVLKFNHARNRQYTTYFIITMPAVAGANFSGAVSSRTFGFTEAVDHFGLTLSGASKMDLNVQATQVDVSLSGSSIVNMIGEGAILVANVSGASKLSAFDYPVNKVESVVSGASHVKVNATQQLKVSVTGASEVRYRGNPAVNAEVSGASSVTKD